MKIIRRIDKNIWTISRSWYSSRISSDNIIWNSCSESWFESVHYSILFSSTDDEDCSYSYCFLEWK